MGKIISFEDFEFNQVTKILADSYFDFIGFVYSHELYDSDRYNHTKVIDIKYLDNCSKEDFAGEWQAYYHMHTKYPKSYPLDRNWSIEFLPHFQDPKKMAKLSPKERVKIIKKEKYELLKQIYDKETFYLTLEEMNINPLKYEPVSYIFWGISNFFKELKKIWKKDKSLKFHLIAHVIIWPLLIFDITSTILTHFFT